MEPIRNIVGFDIGLEEHDQFFTISVTSGSIIGEPRGDVSSHSMTRTKEAQSRRVRVYLAPLNPPANGRLRDLGYAFGFDDEQNSKRGVYSDGLIVVGYVEIPAIAATSVASTYIDDRPINAKREKTLLRIIRALDAMAKLPNRGAATSIVQQLQELGFDSPDDDTVRGVITAARKLEKD